MRTDALVDRLSRDLRPVRRHSVTRDAALLGALGALELAFFLGMGLMRPDMPDAVRVPAFWWKLFSTGLLAAGSAGVAVLSADPARSPRAGLRWLMAGITLVLAAGWLLDASGNGFPELAQRLNWRQGLQCVWKMVALSIPPAVAMGVLLRRGAPTDRAGSALAASLASGCWGAFVFVFACPSDDPLYVAVWYTLGCSIVALAGRTVLIRLSRW